MQPRKLKIGLFLDTFQVPAWVYSTIQGVIYENDGEIKLVILNAGKEGEKNTDRSRWIYSIFNRMDERLFTKKPGPFKPKNILELLAQVPVLKVHPVQEDHSWLLNEADVRNIKEHDLDILVKFGFEDMQRIPPNLATYGTWFYHHGDIEKMKGGPAGFWEVVDHQPETGSALLAVGAASFNKRVLYRSNYHTYPVSPARHRSYYFWATTPFLKRQVKLLHQYGEEKFLQETEKFNSQAYPDIRNNAAPSNLSAAISIIKIIYKLIQDAWNRFFYVDQWFLLYSLTRDIDDGFGTFDRLTPPKDKFWADPHVVRENGKYYIFIEELTYLRNKGHISVIEMDEAGNWKAPVKVLEKDYHLSYPFIFNWQGRYYMVPESGANRTIDIYECVEFPHKWRFKQTLMKNVKAVDSSLIHYSGKWWLFTAMAENEAAAPNVELFLYYADDPFTEKWTAHPQNPVISDVKSARPAGDLFIKDGKLFRPSQDCSVRYGYGFDLNEVVALSQTEYCERRTTSARPDWDRNILGTHTFAKQGNLTVIDAFRTIRKMG